MFKLKLEEIVKLPEKEAAKVLARVRQHPAYLMAMKELEEAGEQFKLGYVAGDNKSVEFAKASAAEKIGKRLYPLSSTAHLGVKLEREISDRYNAEVQALIDAGFSKYIKE